MKDICKILKDPYREIILVFSVYIYIPCDRRYGSTSTSTGWYLILRVIFLLII